MSVFPAGSPMSVEERANAVYQHMVNKAESKASLLRWFRAWDWDHAGSIDRTKLIMGMKQLHFNVDDDVAEALISLFDFDHNGTIDYHEFCSVLRPAEMRGTNFFAQRKYPNEVAPSDLRPVLTGAYKGLAASEIGEKIFSELRTRAQATKSLFSWFRSWDHDKNGRINRAEFVSGLRGMQYHVDDSVVDYLLHKFDMDDNNEIIFAEFAQTLCPAEEKFQSQNPAHNVVYSELKPSKAMVDRVMTRLWQRLPDDKDLLANLLTTYDDNLTGVLPKLVFRKAILGLQLLKDFEVDLICNCEDFDMGGRHINYKLFLQDAARVGSFDDTIDAGRSPRLQATFKPQQLSDTLTEHRAARRRESQLNLSPRNTVATRFENTSRNMSNNMASLLSPRDAPLQFVDEAERFAKSSSYLPDQEQRANKRANRLAALQARKHDTDYRVNESVNRSTQHAHDTEAGRLHQMRQQQLWYGEQTQNPHDAFGRPRVERTIHPTERRGPVGPSREPAVGASRSWHGP